MATEKNKNVPAPADMHAEIHRLHTKANVADHPTMVPPSSQQQAGAGLVTGQKVISTFGSANATNQYLNITNAGWLKISTVNANEHMAMNIIGNHAYEKQSIIYYSLNTSNQVQEIYAW